MKRLMKAFKPLMMMRTRGISGPFFNHHHKVGTKAMPLSKSVGNFYAEGAGGAAPIVENLGPELITNGDFATDTLWIKGPGWSILPGDGAETDGQLGEITNAVVATFGITYRLTFDIISQVSAGDGLHIRVAESSNQAAFQGVGPKSVAVVAGFSSPKLSFWVDPANSFIGKFSNVSLKEVL